MPLSWNEIKDRALHFSRDWVNETAETTVYREQDPVNIQAAERMGQLHDQLKAMGYDGHALEAYLVRLLFCLFAEDTSLFERRQFQDLIEQRTAEDGQDVAHWLADLFQVLNTPSGQRLKKLDEQLAAFPYVNGSLFAEPLPIAAFDRGMRQRLLDCCALDWSRISPAIFGSLFQSVMDSVLRRNLGAHYTTEPNILKLIGPLFLDELRAEFERIKAQPRKLAEFHQRLSQLRFLDPACGCGNFLVIAYRELRRLELDVLRILHKNRGTASLDVAQFTILCDVDQFYGIEIAEFPAQIAQTALWLMDHQMNLQVSEEFGSYFVRLPLRKSATIIHGNALRQDWREIVKPADLNYILGNPPFGGKKEQSAVQKQEMTGIFADVPGAGVLDLVTAWYRKAVDFMADNPAIKAAFVSTNSITQGEQVGVLWSDLLKRGVKIHFAHQAFQWTSEAQGKAAVHCVIIGFALHNVADKRIFEYEHPKGDLHEIKAKVINPYLIDAPIALIERRSNPLISGIPKMVYGSMPIDNGNLILSSQARAELLSACPNAEKYVRQYVGGDEFINKKLRYCLWLVDCDPAELRLPGILQDRIKANQDYRRSSQRSQTRILAKTPAAFGEIRQPSTPYLLIPKVSSENRDYIPIGFCSPNVIAGGTTLIIPAATLYSFGVLQSAMHMAWMRTVGGRMEISYQYSAGIVYNNFPWPQNPTEQQQQGIETAAQAVLEVRAQFPDSSLADLYDPLSMPEVLTKAHQRLDAAVDAAYVKRKFTGDRDRVAFLFTLYQQLSSPLEANKKLRRKQAG